LDLGLDLGLDYIGKDAAEVSFFMRFVVVKARYKLKYYGILLLPTILVISLKVGIVTIVKKAFIYELVYIAYVVVKL
jgi:hypothetical protein